MLEYLLVVVLFATLYLASRVYRKSTVASKQRWIREETRNEPLRLHTSLRKSRAYTRVQYWRISIIDFGILTPMFLSTTTATRIWDDEESGFRHPLFQIMEDPRALFLTSFCVRTKGIIISLEQSGSRLSWFESRTKFSSKRRG